MIDSIKEANGFQDTNKEERFNIVNRCIQQVVHQILFISNIWKETMFEDIYLKCMGMLVDEMLLIMIDQLQHLKDIAESETHKLYEIFINFFKCEPLFPYDVSLHSFSFNYSLAFTSIRSSLE
jgi:hypothetical protein